MLNVTVAALLIAFTDQSAKAAIDIEAPPFGSVTGQFLYDGEPPEAGFLIPTRDAERCGSRIPREDLVVDAKTHGIRHVAIFLKKKPHVVHPDLRKLPSEKVRVKYDGCRLSPHLVRVRANQTVEFSIRDEVVHSVMPMPLRNLVSGRVIPRQPIEEFLFAKAEPVPIPVRCAVHPHENAYWLILDHPYSAITDSKGRFRIEKLPAGKHEFRTWHERTGWFHKSMAVNIEPGKTTELGKIRIAPERFEKTSRSTSRQPQPTPPPLPVGKCGTLTGRFVVESELPVRRIAPPVGARPGAVRQPIVDPKTRALRQVAVYLRDSNSLPREFRALPLPKRPVTATIKNEQIIPQVAIVRTGQPLQLHNRDRQLHYIITNMVRNQLSGAHSLPTGMVLEFTFENVEKYPGGFSSATSPTMRSWCLVLDHPFHDLTAENGRFRITDLPPGEHEFRSWHRYCGWVEKSLKVNIEAGKVTDLGDIAVPASKLFPR